MKAQEYYEKYFENAQSADEIQKNAGEMYRDIAKEYSEILEKRKPKTIDGAVGIVRELNEKWNSVANKVEAKFAVKILKRNAIWNTLLAEKYGERFKRKPD